MCVYVYVCTYLYMYMCILTYMHIHIYALHIYVYIHTRTLSFSRTHTHTLPYTQHVHARVHYTAVGVHLEGLFVTSLASAFARSLHRFCQRVRKRYVDEKIGSLYSQVALEKFLFLLGSFAKEA